MSLAIRGTILIFFSTSKPKNGARRPKMDPKIDASLARESDTFVTDEQVLHIRCLNYTCLKMTGYVPAILDTLGYPWVRLRW